MLFGIFNYTKKHIQKYMMRVFVLKVLRGGGIPDSRLVERLGNIVTSPTLTLRYVEGFEPSNGWPELCFNRLVYN